MLRNGLCGGAVREIADSAIMEVRRKGCHRPFEAILGQGANGDGWERNGRKEAMRKNDGSTIVNALCGGVSNVRSGTE